MAPQSIYLVVRIHVYPVGSVGVIVESFRVPVWRFATRATGSGAFDGDGATVVDSIQHFTWSKSPQAVRIATRQTPGTGPSGE